MYKYVYYRYDARVYEITKESKSNFSGRMVYDFIDYNGNPNFVCEACDGFIVFNDLIDLIEPMDIVTYRIGEDILTDRVSSPNHSTEPIDDILEVYKQCQGHYIRVCYKNNNGKLVIE